MFCFFNYRTIKRNSQPRGLKIETFRTVSIISRKNLDCTLHFFFVSFAVKSIYLVPFRLLVGVADEDPSRSEGKKSEVGVDIVIRDVGKPTVCVGLFICRDEGDREEEMSPRHVQETKYTGWSDRVCGRPQLHLHLFSFPGPSSTRPLDL